MVIGIVKTVRFYAYDMLWKVVGVFFMNEFSKILNGFEFTTFSSFRQYYVDYVYLEP